MQWKFRYMYVDSCKYVGVENKVKLIVYVGMYIKAEYICRQKQYET